MLSTIEMSNRNFDSRTIIQRLQNQVYARNLYANNTTGQLMINNPQTTDGNSSRYASYHSGAQTEYARGLLGNGETISVGGIIGIPPFPVPTLSSTPSDLSPASSASSASSTSSTSSTSSNIFTFTAVGTTTWTAPEGITSVHYLVVGGGGGSGGGIDTGGGGGGGGGMVFSGTMSVIPGNTYTIVVGDGGNGGMSTFSPFIMSNGLSGEHSVFDSITALGGGGGYVSRLPSRSNNGLGGYGSINPATASGGGHGGRIGAGGGGGGSSSGGSNGVSNTGGAGGSGTESSISGSSLVYGNGGRGANGNVDYPATAGLPNTGNGANGGGSASLADNNGAKGGYGIVIISFY